MADGSQKERDFIALLEDEYGFAAMRAPASGGATKRELPDVLAGRPFHHGLAVYSDLWAFECKYRKAERYYMSKDVEDVFTYAEAIGAEARTAHRWNSRAGNAASGDTNWYLNDSLDRFHETDTKYRVDYEVIAAECPTLEEVFNAFAESA